MNGWIGVDFDGTLAHYTTWVAAGHCGAPIEAMVERVKAWLANGREVRIFTARVFPITTVINYGDIPGLQAGMNSMGLGSGRVGDALKAADAIQAWSKEHIGQVLPITCVKDFAMIELYDDRCVQVLPNTGQVVGRSTRGFTESRDGEHIYNLYRQEMEKLSVGTDDFGSLDALDQTVWHCLASRLGLM